MIKKIIIGVLIVIIVLTVAMIKPKDETCEVFESIGDESNNQIEEVKEIEKTEEIVVYLYGKIKNEGVYTVKKDTRVYEVVEKAGGLEENALLGYVNLARKLEDGESIYFPNLEEKELLQNDEKNQLVNINSASKEELTKIPGVGESKANAIIKYRTKKGKFKKIEDIMKISGIKKAAFEAMEDYIKI